MSDLTVTVALGDECTQTTHSERHNDIECWTVAFGECVMHCAASNESLGIQAIAAIVESVMASLDVFEHDDDHGIRMAIAQIGTACEAAEERLGPEVTP